jgi:hypothetical protein
VRKEEVKSIRAWAAAAGITDELSLFEDCRPPVDKPDDGIKYEKVGEFVHKEVALPVGYSLYRKVKTND